MSILDRYLTRQLFVTALFAIAVLTVVLVLGNVFKKLLDLFINQNAPTDILVSIIGYVLPFSLTFTIPWGFLTAVLLVFGRMSAENEITALRSSGISIPRLCVPVALMAALFAVICLYINMEVAPRSQTRMKNALNDLLTSNPLSVFGSDKIIDVFPGQKIYVEKSNGSRIENMIVYKHDDTGNLQTVTAAGTGTLVLDKEQKQLVLSYNDLRYEQIEVNPTDSKDRRGIKSGIKAEEGQVSVSLKELFERQKRIGGIGTMSLEQLMDDSESTSSDPKKRAEEAIKRKVELNKRISTALATIAFALLAVPLAITAQRKETSVGFAISLGIAMLYFMMLIAAEMVRKPSLHPELLVWLPNVIFLSIGAYRFAQLAKR
jgi:LPS export ABC transporter permease LptF